MKNPIPQTKAEARKKAKEHGIKYFLDIIAYEWKSAPGKALFSFISSIALMFAIFWCLNWINNESRYCIISDTYNNTYDIYTYKTAIPIWNDIVQQYNLNNPTPKIVNPVDLISDKPPIFAPTIYCTYYKFWQYDYE